MKSRKKDGCSDADVLRVNKETKEFLFDDYMTRNFAIVEDIRNGKKTLGDLVTANMNLIMWNLFHKIKWEMYDDMTHEDAQQTIICVYMETAQKMMDDGCAFDKEFDFGKLMLETISNTKLYLASKYYSGGICMPYPTQKNWRQRGKELPHIVEKGGRAQDVAIWHTPERKFLEKEEIANLHTAFESLNAQEKEVVTLRYCNGKKIREVSEILGISNARVVSISNRAILKLAEKLK